MTPEELADARYDWNWDNDGTGPVRVFREQLHDLAADSAALGAVKALEEAADRAEYVQRYTGHDFAVSLREKAATYTDRIEGGTQ